MKIAGMLCWIVFLCGVSFAQKYSCLPPGIKEDTTVSSTELASPKGEMTIRKTTVGESLKKLNARCTGGKLVDRRRKPVTFYHLQGCWGNPPADYLEIMERQSEELRNLRKKYTVVEMSCNPSGFPIP